MKFDIEGSEWDVITTMLKDGVLSQVKQIAFEIHNLDVNDTPKLRKHWSILTALENQGFQFWNWFPNMDTQHWGYKKSQKGRIHTPLANIHYVNVKFL